jgi:hypothetical protein
MNINRACDLKARGFDKVNVSENASDQKGLD